jgi:hypothetical protein
MQLIFLPTCETARDGGWFTRHARQPAPWRHYILNPGGDVARP